MKASKFPRWYMWVRSEIGGVRKASEYRLRWWTDSFKKICFGTPILGISKTLHAPDLVQSATVQHLFVNLSSFINGRNLVNIARKYRLAASPTKNSNKENRNGTIPHCQPPRNLPSNHPQVHPRPVACNTLVLPEYHGTGPVLKLSIKPSKTSAWSFPHRSSSQWEGDSGSSKGVENSVGRFWSNYSISPT